MCPFGHGHDHGEAFRELLQVYGVLSPAADGFAASVDGNIVFLNREDAYEHAKKFNQLKPGASSTSGRLNSEMLAWLDNDGDNHERLSELDCRMRDFYWMLKAKWKIDNIYSNIPKLSDAEKEQIIKTVSDVCDFSQW